MTNRRFRIGFSLILALIFIAGCQPVATNEPDTADAVVTSADLPLDDKPATSAWDIPEGPEIRVYNGTGANAATITLAFPAATLHFGALDSGQYSAYRTPAEAYSFAAITVVSTSGTYHVQPRDYVGVEPLPAGRYTFELSLDGGQLRLDLIDDLPYLSDARSMAGELGIPLEEALAQLDDQDAIGMLNAQLMANESETFAGLWIEREPAYRVVVAFTEDGEATLTPYVAGSDIEEQVAVVTVGRSLAELGQIQDDLTSLLQAIGFPASSGIAVQSNQVELYLTDEARFDAALAAADLSLPEGVTRVVVYEPAPGPPPNAQPVPDVFMPQLAVQSGAFMEALLVGQLVVSDGCLAIGQDNGDRHVMIWQPDYFLSEQEGAIVVLDRDGQVVATVGEPIYVGGGEVSGGAIRADDLQAPIPDACTAGRYWLMGEFLPEEFIPNVTE